MSEITPSMNKIDLINSMKITDYDADGTALYYCHVDNSEVNKEILRQVGVLENEITENDNGEEIDISNFAWQHAKAKWFDPNLGGFLDYVPEDGDQHE